MKLAYNDKVHGYWLDGKRCKGISTTAKVGLDTYTLDNWRKRQVAIGLAKSPHLVEAVAAHWQDRSKLDDLCEEAMVAAGAAEAATKGTAAHRVTENVDLGTDQILTNTGIKVARNWRKVLDAAGIDIVPDYIERVVVFPDEFLCGRYDRIGRRRSDGKLVVIDLKTGASAVRYPHAVATQMAMYANAPLVAVLPPDRDATTEEFHPQPEMDLKVGYMVHMSTDDLDMGAELYSVNIALGWKAVQQVVFPAVRWRSVPNAKLIKAV